MSFSLGLLLLSLIELVSCLDQVVKTKNGLVRGTTVQFENIQIQAFFGVPFAEPPVGELRFRKPRPVKEWSGVRDATKMSPACIQFSFYPFPWYDFKDDKSEDCLYLNIWLLAKTRASDRKAVMFWIYGGGFTVGSITKPEYDGRLLTFAGDVIVVTVNYRMASLGFLYSGSDEAPGNVGMYDQLMAMQWVNENIKYFGGDPKRVTLFGQSAGSIAISLWCISPLTKGLFHRVIMESGSAAFFRSDHKNSSLSLSQKLAKAVDCATDEKTIDKFPEEVVGCLRSMI
ncbi:Cholinesterase, partial [Stegodyphus mimosarum]